VLERWQSGRHFEQQLSAWLQDLEGVLMKVHVRPGSEVSLQDLRQSDIL